MRWVFRKESQIELSPSLNKYPDVSELKSECVIVDGEIPRKYVLRKVSSQVSFIKVTPNGRRSVMPIYHGAEDLFVTRHGNDGMNVPSNCQSSEYGVQQRDD